ncbi:MAG: hypothetical protein ACOX4L_02610 [Bacillota bacterium]
MKGSDFIIGKGKIKLEKYPVNMVPTVVNWGGTTRMYYQGANGNFRSIVELKLNNQLLPISEKTLPFPSNEAAISYYPFPVVQSSGGDGQEKLHLFADIPSGDYRVIAGLLEDNDRLRLQPVGGKQNPLRVKKYSFFSVASYNEGIIFVVLDKENREINLYLVDWDNIYTFKNVVKKTIEVPEEKLNFINIHSACVVVMPHDDVTDMEIHLLLGLSYIYKDESGIYFGELNVPIGGEDADIDSFCSWKKHPNRLHEQVKILTSMILSPSGSVYAISLDIKRGLTNNLDNLLTSQAKSINLWRRDNINKWVDLGNPLDEDPGEIIYPGCIGYIAGEVKENVSVQNSTLTDKILPLNRVFFWVGSNKTQINFQREDYGRLQRRGLKQVQSEKNILIGILEGPPPIPRENMNISDNYDPSERGTGKTVYSKVETSTFAYNLDFKGGIIGKYSMQGGCIGYAKAEGSLSIGYKFAYERKIVETKTTSFEVIARKQKKGDEYTLQPLGAAVVLSIGWTGYAYEYVAPDGMVPKYTPVFYQVFPLENELHLASRPYAINPNTGPVPGELNSYFVSPEKKKLYNEKAIQLVNGKNHLSSSWSASGKVVESFERYVENTFTNGFYIDLQALIGAAWEDWIFSKGEIMCGVKFEMNMTWKTAKGEKLGLYSECQTRGNVACEGTYTSYDYYTYQLTPDNQWEKEFLANLLTKEWPEDENYKKYNKSLKDSIVPGSKPWKVVYVLAGAKKN